MVLSTWSVLFLTVGPDVRTNSMWENWRKQVHLLRRKLYWMVMMLMFPEYLLAIGFANLFTALQNTPTLKELAEEDHVLWTLRHTVLADLGGIAVRFPKVVRDESTKARSKESSRLVAKDKTIAQLEVSGNSNDISLDVVQRLQQTQNPHQTTSIQTLPPEDPKSLCGHDAILSVSEVPPKDNNETFSTIVRDDLTEDVVDIETARNAAGHEECQHNTSPSPPIVVPLPRFLTRFRERQEQACRGLGTLSWEPLDRHVKLAVEYNRPPNHIPPISKSNHVAPLQGNIWILDAKQLAEARKQKVISRLPQLEIEEILDKSKSDGLVRLLAVGQVLWLVVQLIGRRAAHTASSALEFSTLAFSSCAAIIYLLEWCKAKDVGVPHYIDTGTTVSAAAFSVVVESGPNVFMRKRIYTMPQSCVHQIFGDREREGKRIDKLIVLSCIGSTTIFGGIHLLAWHASFPNRAEQLLWRVAALLVTAIPSTVALIVLTESTLYSTTNKTSAWSSICFSPLYFGSRVFLIVESFRSLYYLPPNGFIATWATESPHIG
jgi:hypothetical protein